MKPLEELLLFGVVVTLLFALTRGYTNPSDTAVLQNLFTSLNSPSQQLLGWNGFGSADPCGGGWKGITCSASAVTEIDLSNLGLTGSLGYMLDQLLSLTKMDVSGNHISGNIPYQLPPNLRILNFASNDLSGGNLPYSIASMRSLRYLNVGHNQLSASIADVFQNLGHLSTLDMSFNLLTGSLPQSFASLSNISILYLQNNQLSGTLSILNDLTLQDVNVENNQFTGWVPSNFPIIPHASYGGNNFNNSPAPPPPPYTSPPWKGGSGSPTSSPARIPKSDSASKHTESGRGTVLNGGAIAGIVIAGFLCAVVVVLLILYFCWKACGDHRDVEKQQSAATTFRPTTSPIIKVGKERSDPKSKSSVVDVALKPPPVESHKVVLDKSNGKISASKRSRSPISAATYSVADLQIATNSFSQENLVGEGALGRVYRAEMPTGKVLAVKKMDSSVSSVQKDEEFTEIVCKISRLRHSNIAELVGYCTEHGQRLLVYDYFGRGTLHDLLYSPDDSTKRELSWNVRVKIALGTARGLEYLHEVCLPAVVHKNCKSANILLDEELNPHLSDCGIAAFSPSPERQVSTQMMGSFGYSAPEYAMSGIYTAKSDVYSFGVIMLELLTGRKPLDSSRPRSEQSLVRWATPQLHDIDSLAKMVDLALKGMYPAKSLSRFADIIALCVQPEPEFRPLMSEVVQLLVRLMQRATPSKRRSSESTDVFEPSELSLQGTH